MGGGGGGQKMLPPAQIQPVPQVDLPMGGYSGIGYTQVPQTFVPEAKPDWMKGWWDMPSWGMDAVTGKPLTQEQLQPKKYEPPPKPEPEEEKEKAPQMDPRRMYDLFARQQAWERRRDDLNLQDGWGNASDKSNFMGPSPMSFMYGQQSGEDWHPWAGLGQLFGKDPFSR